MALGSSRLKGLPGIHRQEINMSATKWNARTVPDLIIEVWEALDCESVGAVEIQRIQEVLREKFGEGASESPASIARTVADEGAALRHPEIFDFDAEWRAAKLAESDQGDLSFENLREAIDSFAKLDEMRQRLEGVNDEKGVDRLRDQILKVRAESELRARSRIIDELGRAEAREISHWLMVWLQSPELFLDWLDLRQRSPEFIKKFHV